MAVAPTTTIDIAPPGLRDIESLQRLFRQALRQDFQYFPPSYTDRICRQNNFWHLLMARFRHERIMEVAKLHGAIVGYALGSVTPQGNGELYWLYVDPAQRTHDIGARLLDTVMRELQERGAAKLTLVTYDLKDYYLHRGFEYRGKQRIHSLDFDVMEYKLGAHGRA
jgi:ribosomal protein S18 acetylase RimI-like enzyme